MSAIEMRPRSNIQWTVPHKAMPCERVRLRCHDGADMDRLDFASAAAVYDFQADKWAGVFVRRLDGGGKSGFRKWREAVRIRLPSFNPPPSACSVAATLQFEDES